MIEGVVVVTQEELLKFLRSRRSPTCRVMADWAEENPQHPAVTKAAFRLAEFVTDAVGETVNHIVQVYEVGGASAWRRHLACRDATAIATADALVRAFVGMRPHAETPLLTWHLGPEFRTAASRITGRRAKSWASSISRTLTSAR